MKIKKFIYSTFFPTIALNLSIGKEITKKSLLNIYKPTKVTDNEVLNNYIENLWNHKDYIKLASILKEDSSLLSEEQKEIIFFQLTQKLYANIETDSFFSDTKTFSLEYFPDDDYADIFSRASGLLLILKSNPEFFENYKEYLKNNYSKFSHSLPLYISKNKYYCTNPNSLFFQYLEQSNKIPEIFNTVNMSDLNSKTQQLLSVIVLSLRKIKSNNFLENLEDNVKLKLEDKSTSIESLTFFYKKVNEVKRKANETNIEYNNKLKLISIPPTALTATLYSNIIEYNLSNPDKLMPVPLIFAAAYYISKKLDDINFDFSENEYQICLKANETYIVMYSENDLMTNQEHLNKFFKQNLYCFNNNNKEIKQLSHLDYLLMVKNSNYEQNNYNYQISTLIKSISENNSEIDLSFLENSLQMLFEIDENNNKLKKSEEVRTFIENTQKTIISILNNYIICNNNISVGINNKQLLDEPLKLIHESINNAYCNINEQNLSSFINYSKQHKKI